MEMSSVAKLGHNEPVSTAETQQMGLSRNSDAMVFQMFTKSVYSDPIGTVVREITSNCFDSHAEAGVDMPIIIRKTKDNDTESHSISFIDFGVGISPDRMKNIYGVYFESTKRQTNGQIGGFGIGGKTPLAYKRSTGEGENEYDNSYTVTTVFDKVKYVYNVFEGKVSPEFALMFSEPTNESNGTEVKIPILEKDISDFEYAIKTQLYYFDNIVFDGFDDSYRVVNDYKIFKGEHFMYRGSSVHSCFHVCVGKVNYPINFGKLGLSQYDYNVPIGVSMPIGSVDVTVSRELLDYSEKTITNILKAIELAKMELTIMLESQLVDVVTYLDYINKNDDFFQLNVGDDAINLKPLYENNHKFNLPSYKYSALGSDVPSLNKIISILYDSIDFGRKTRSSNTGFDSHNINRESSHIYMVSDRMFDKVRIKQAYLKDYHRSWVGVYRNTDSVVNTKTMSLFGNEFNKLPTYSFIGEDGSNLEVARQIDNKSVHTDLIDLIWEMYNEVIEYVDSKKFTNYDDVEVSEYFKAHYGRRKVPTELLKDSIPVDLIGGQKTRMRISDLIKYKGRVFYGVTKEKDDVIYARNAYRELFDRSKLVNRYHSYDRYCSHEHRSYKGISNQKGIMFITISKTNVRYMKHLKNAMHYSTLKEEMFDRKKSLVSEAFFNAEIRERRTKLNDITPIKYMSGIKPKLDKLIESYNDYNYNMNNLNTFDVYRFIEFYDLNKEDFVEPKWLTDGNNNIIKLNAIIKKNEEVFNFIEFNRWEEDEDKKIATLNAMLKKLMVFR